MSIQPDPIVTAVPVEERVVVTQPAVTQPAVVAPPAAVAGLLGWRLRRF